MRRGLEPGQGARARARHSAAGLEVPRAPPCSALSGAPFPPSRSTLRDSRRTAMIGLQYSHPWTRRAPAEMECRGLLDDRPRGARAGSSQAPGAAPATSGGSRIHAPSACKLAGPRVIEASVIWNLSDLHSSDDTWAMLAVKSVVSLPPQCVLASPARLGSVWQTAAQQRQDATALMTQRVT